MNFIIEAGHKPYAASFQVNGAARRSRGRSCCHLFIDRHRRHRLQLYLHRSLARLVYASPPCQLTKNGVRKIAFCAIEYETGPIRLRQTQLPQSQRALGWFRGEIFDLLE